MKRVMPFCVGRYHYGQGSTSFYDIRYIMILSDTLIVSGQIHF